MRALHHPDVASVTLPGMLNALADEVRLSVVRQLAEAGGVVCGQFDVPVSMSTLSHHLKVLREAGLLRVTPEGSFRRHELRLAEMETRFPGVLTSILQAA
ncbi:helix-turn-helix transcriptional regulator [Streptosporangium oxazolinicum]|uniref:Helix-turn-helix transcriptional regulator n=1 Tax=Streptosporangium oxazolinicum TaxID=909287 RepID=A0ABP8ADT1_9ACTN|nr:helix-turn-helix domain-containing protein [Streptosporangium sp. NBC_01495]